MHQIVDLTGKTFGKLTVLQLHQPHIRKQTKWDCVCFCGEKTTVRADKLRSGHTKSCGCIRIKHGLHESPIYKVWSSIKQRCNSVNRKDYGAYGGRGIILCDEWHNFTSFLHDMGPTYKKGLQIDRINNDLGYSKNNCHWVSSKINSRNRRSTIYIDYKGESLCASEWAEKFGLRQDTFHLRRKLGWSMERIEATPVKGAR